MAEKITFYLVRHGEADSNALGLLSSFPEVEKNVRHLTEKGKGQIEEVAKHLSGEKVDVIISSPLTRTKETAAIIAAALEAPVLYDIRLRETDFGMYNSLSTKDFFTKYPNPRLRVETSGGDGLESFSNIRGRAESFLEDVKREFPGGTLVVVSPFHTLQHLPPPIPSKDLSSTTRGWMPPKGSCTKVEWNS